MFKFLIKIAPTLIFWGIFGYVILQVPYPDTLTQANLQQLLFFFIPLFFAIILTLNIILKNIFSSASISLGLVFLLILKALDSLNLVTGVLTVIAVGLLISYFRKMNRRSLTKLSKISKLTHLRKEK